MLNLGRFLLLSLLITQYLLGSISAKLDRDVITDGTDATLTITVYGDKIEEPRISRIAGYEITGISTESFFNSINGVVTKGKRYHYNFSPDKNVTIEPLEFIVDGKVEKTPPLKLRVVEPTFNNKDPFILQISTDKDRYYLGESIKLTVHYQEDLSQDVIDRRYSEPSSDALWQKYKSSVRDGKDNQKYHIYMDYIFTPQKVGKIRVHSAKMKIGTRARQRDSWGFLFESAKWHNVVSNSLNLEILPSPTKLVGDFNISATVDKKEVASGEAVNLNLTIRGTGNIEDISPFSLKVQNGIVYDEKPKIEHKLVKGKYIGTFSQKFAIVLNKSSQIPQFQIEYFNPERGKIVTKRTPKIDIDVNATQSPIQSETLKIERGDKENTLKDLSKVGGVDRNTIYLIAGGSFLLGILLTTLWFISPLQKLGVWNKMGKLLKRDRELLKKILPKVHENSRAVEVAEKLNKKIYKGEKVKISRKEIKEII